MFGIVTYVEKRVALSFLLKKWDDICHKIPYGVDKIFEAIEREGVKLEDLDESFQSYYKEKKSLRRTIEELKNDLGIKRDVFSS